MHQTHLNYHSIQVRFRCSPVNQINSFNQMGDAKASYEGPFKRLRGAYGSKFMSTRLPVQKMWFMSYYNPKHSWKEILWLLRGDYNASLRAQNTSCLEFSFFFNYTIPSLRLLLHTTRAVMSRVTRMGTAIKGPRMWLGGSLRRRPDSEQSWK